MNNTEKTSNELALERTDLAFKRTVMAADRTLMAWVRTGLSIISFGFTVYKVLEAVQTKAGPLRKIETPRDVGLFMTAAGVIALVLGVLEYVASMQDLRHEQPVRMWRPSLMFAAAIAVAGVLLFIGIARHIL